RAPTCPLAPRYRPEPPVIGNVKFSDRLMIVPWVVICPPGRIEVVGHWASTLAALAVDTNVQTTPIRPTCLPFCRRLPENTTSSPRLKPDAPTSIFGSNSVNTAVTRIVWPPPVDPAPWLDDPNAGLTAPTTRAITAMTPPSMTTRFPMVPSSPAIRVMALTTRLGSLAPAVLASATGQSEWPVVGLVACRLAGGLAGLGGGRVAGQGLVQLGAGADGELGEHLAQVVLDRAGADEQPSADLLVGEAVIGEPGDLQLLRGELAARLDRAFSDRLAGGLM